MAMSSWRCGGRRRDQGRTPRGARSTLTHITVIGQLVSLGECRRFMIWGPSALPLCSAKRDALYVGVRWLLSSKTWALLPARLCRTNARRGAEAEGVDP